MRLFKDATIKGKLMLISMFTTAAAMFFVSIAVILFWNFIALLSTFLIAFIISYLLISRLYKTILAPINELAQIMSIVSDKKDYSVRANIISNDELGILSNGFNEMLQRTQEQDKKLEEYHKNLEELLERRTRKLVQNSRELKETRAQLIHTSNLVGLGEMAAGIAHEINQPLNIIRLTSQILLQKSEDKVIQPLGEEVKKAIIMIDSQVERIDNIISHLRIFTRRDMIESVSIDINQAIEDVFLLTGEGLRLSSIVVKKDFSPSPIIIKANASMLEQVFFNIISNARDAMEDMTEKQGRLLTITTQLRRDNMAEVRISDTGGGIPREIRGRIFEPFFTTKDVGKGTGLGLSISYGIVKQFGGNISFDVKEGVGTTFILTFVSAL
ncbi:MAG: HAMP domain-containing protein [Deltaproteobacteria bacterium]|nr:HAMP domain-containing protein [Deltaproteobacteria bacterium]